MPSKQKSESKVVLITGCSSGFGLLTAAHLGSKGYRVIATMRNLEKKSALLSEANKCGTELTVLELDVTKEDSVKSCMDTITKTFGCLDVLVNNAGYGIVGSFEDLTQEEIRAQMETNFFGVQNVTRAAIPLMRQCKKGKIINVSSVAGFSTSPLLGAYNASKWALEAFSESLRYELKFFDIDVLLIEPGTYKTEIFFSNAKYAKNFTNPQSPYFEISKHLKKRVDNYVKDCHKDSNEIALLIEKLIVKKNPSFRNIPDLESQCRRVLRKVLPFRAYAWIITTALFRNFSQNK